MTMVLRSLYLDPLTDSALASRAEQEGITKAELMRRFLLDGLRRPASMFAGYETPRQELKPVKKIEEELGVKKKTVRKVATTRTPPRAAVGNTRTTARR